MEAVEEIVKIIRSEERFLIVSHIHPDGDSIGSQLALLLILEEMGKRCVIMNEEMPPKNLSFLPCLERIKPPADGEYGTILILDANEWDRLGKRTRAVVEKQRMRVNIDHHLGEGIGDIVWVDTTFSSCSEMIYELSTRLAIEMDKKKAILLYTGIAVDTGFFSFINTSPKCLIASALLLGFGISSEKIKEALYSTKSVEEVRFAARVLSGISEKDGVVWIRIYMKMIDELGFEPEVDSILDEARKITSGKITVLLREIGRYRTKASFRSKEGINVASVAKRFGGGGHLQAAGCVIDLPIEEAEKEIHMCLGEKEMNFPFSAPFDKV
jgi:phosphoesterase RecJ-like protein